MRGENDAGSRRRLEARRQPSTLPSASISTCSSLSSRKRSRQPLGARLLAEGRRRDRDQVVLPLHDLALLQMEPAEGRVNAGSDAS